MVSDLLEHQTDLIRRLHCAEGHLRGIARMVERRADSQSIVRQVLAVQAALNEINSRVVQHQLRACLQDTNADITAREKHLADIVSLYQLLGASGLSDIEKEFL